jgi:hypothetical protein
MAAGEEHAGCDAFPAAFLHAVAERALRQAVLDGLSCGDQPVLPSENG